MSKKDFGSKINAMCEDDLSNTKLRTNVFKEQSNNEDEFNSFIENNIKTYYRNPVAFSPLNVQMDDEHYIYQYVRCTLIDTGEEDTTNLIGMQKMGWEFCSRYDHPDLAKSNPATNHPSLVDYVVYKDVVLMKRARHLDDMAKKEFQKMNMRIAHSVEGMVSPDQMGSVSAIHMGRNNVQVLNETKHGYINFND